MIAVAALASLLSLGFWAAALLESGEVAEAQVGVSLRVTGRLDTAGATLGPEELEALRILAVLPEIPYEGSSTVLASGAFSVLLDVPGVARPRVVLLEAAVNGERWQLLEAALPEEGHLDLGTVPFFREQLEEEEPESIAPPPRAVGESEQSPERRPRRLRDLSRRELKSLLRGERLAP